MEVALAEQRQVAAQVLEEVLQVDRARLDQAAGLGAGQREHVVDEPVHLVQPPQQRRGCPRGGALVGLAVQQLDLGAQHGQRRAQLVRGVRDEVALAREGALEPLEHAVERGGEHADLAAGADRPGAQREVAGVDRGGDRRHAPQRPRDQRRDQHAGGDGERERERPDQRERPQQARLRVADRRQRVGDVERPIRRPSSAMGG